MQAIQVFLTRLGVFVAHPAAFLVATVFAVLWIAFDRESLNWHGGAALATLFMTLLIQRAEHRDHRRSTPSWMNFSGLLAKRAMNSLPLTRKNRRQSSGIESGRVTVIGEIGQK